MLKTAPVAAETVLIDVTHKPIKEYAVTVQDKYSIAHSFIQVTHF